MQTISNIADALGFKSEHVLPYGHYKAKISLDAIAEGKAEQGKLVVVTGITPTPAGEGKTTTAIGLTQGMGRLGHKVSVNLREPTLGPIFGIKGRRHRRRQRPYRSRGRNQHSLHRRRPRRRVGPQPAGRAGGQRGVPPTPSPTSTPRASSGRG